MLSWYKQYRRRRLLARPLPERWETILRRNVAVYSRLGEDERRRLRDVARILVAEKSWEGGAGLPVTEEMKVTIAAQAGLMLLGMAHDYFSHILSVLVYPSAFELPLEDWEDEAGRRGLPIAGQAVYGG